MPNRPYKVALNGYGRIGRCVLRALYERGADAGLEIVALNDLADQASIEYLTRFADKAARAYAHVEAVAALQEAFGLAQGLPAEERERRLLDLVLRQAHSLVFLGRFQETLGPGQ